MKYIFLLQGWDLSPVFCPCEIGNETSGSTTANNFLSQWATAGYKRRSVLHSACVPDVATPWFWMLAQLFFSHFDLPSATQKHYWSYSFPSHLQGCNRCVCVCVCVCVFVCVCVCVWSSQWALETPSRCDITQVANLGQLKSWNSCTSSFFGIGMSSEYWNTFTPS